MRLIDADAVVKDLEWQMDTHNPDWSWTNSAMCYDLIEYLDKVPTVEPKCGEWVEDITCNDLVMCNACGNEAYFDLGIGTYMEFDYCPNCGADMRGDSKCD